MEQKVYITKCIRLLQLLAIRSELKRSASYTEAKYLAARTEQNEQEIEELQHALAVADEKKLEDDMQQILIATGPEKFDLITY